MFIEPLMRAFGASEASLPLAKDYAFWMFVAALANLPAQSMNCAARAESSVKISSIAVITGALLNVVLDPVFMFDWGLGMGVEGASLATTVSQFVTFFILAWFYLSGRSVIKLRLRSFHPSWKLIKTVTVIGIPTAVIQICLSVASSLTNIAAAPLPDADNIIAAYGVVQRLILIGCYVVMGFMQGYQPVASYAFGAKQEDRFHQSVRFALKGSLVLTVLVAAAYILLWLSSSAVPSKTARIRVESSGGAGTPPSPIWVHTTHHRPLHGGTLLSRLPIVAGRNTRQYSSAPVTIPHRSISPHRRRRNSVLR